MPNIVSITVKLDDAAALAQLAALKKAAEGIGGLGFDSPNISSQLIALKQKMQAAGLADLLDFNLTGGQLNSQILLLKRKIQQAGLSDILDVNLNSAQVSEQLSKLGADKIKIPVGYDVSKFPVLGDAQNISDRVNIQGIAAAEAQLAALNAALGETKAAAADAGGSGGMGALTAGMAAAGGAGRALPALLGITAGGWWSLLHVSLSVFGTQLAADAVGLTAFGVAATQAIGPAVSAVGNLSTAYAALDPYQKAAALSLKSFTDGLQIAAEPQIFGNFYQGLSLVQTALSHTGSITQQASNAVGDFLGMLKADLGSAAWADVFGKGTNLIRTDLDALFSLINTGINTIPALFHNLNFLGVDALGAAGGILKAATAILEFNPTLTRAAALAGVAYGAYHILWSGLGAGAGPLQLAYNGIKNLGIRTAAFLGDARDFGLAETIVATGATGMAVTFGSAVLAGLGLAYALRNVHGELQTSIADMQSADHATGNNIAGYQKLASQASALADSWQHVNTIAPQVGRQLADQNVHLQAYASVASTASTAVSNINSNATALGQTLGLTKAQVISFSNATGIDLSKSLDKTGSQFVIDASKIQGFSQAVMLSHNPLSQAIVDFNQAKNAANSLTDQINFLTAGFNALVAPTLNAQSAAVGLRNAEAQAAQAFQTSHDKVGLYTQAQRDATSAMDAAANAALASSQAIFAQTGSAQKAVGPLQQFASWLQTSGAHGAYEAQVLREIKAAEDALYSKQITINVGLTGTGVPYLGQQNAGTGGHGPGHPLGKAAGGVIGAASGGIRGNLTWVGEQGPELVSLPTGSYVHSSPDSQRMWSDGGSGGGGTVVLQVAPGGGELDQLMLTWLKRQVRVKGGGNVQVAFGRH